jgi:tellurite resistance protein
MTDETSHPNTQTDIPSRPVDGSALIAQLQDKLLALGRDIDTLPAADIEKTAKAITTLIGSVEKAEAYLQASDRVVPSDGLTKPSRLALLRKIKRMVENGALDELADHDNV